MLNISCFKCGKFGNFKTVSESWTAGWVPITRDQYCCDICNQLEYSDTFNNQTDELENETKSLPIKKKNSTLSEK